jgi:hypothetical protein
VNSGRKKQIESATVVQVCQFAGRGRTCQLQPNLSCDQPKQGRGTASDGGLSSKEERECLKDCSAMLVRTHRHSERESLLDLMKGGASKPMVIKSLGSGQRREMTKEKGSLSQCLCYRLSDSPPSPFFV